MTIASFSLSFFNVEHFDLGWSVAHMIATITSVAIAMDGIIYVFEDHILFHIVFRLFVKSDTNGDEKLNMSLRKVCS